MNIIRFFSINYEAEYIYTDKKYTRASVLFASSLIQFTQAIYSVGLHLYISKNSFA